MSSADDAIYAFLVMAAADGVALKADAKTWRIHGENITHVPRPFSWLQGRSSRLGYCTGVQGCRFLAAGAPRVHDRQHLDPG